MQIKTKNVSCHKADSKPVKQEVNGTVILPPLVFPGLAFEEPILLGFFKRTSLFQEELIDAMAVFDKAGSGYLDRDVVEDLVSVSSNFFLCCK